MSCPACGVDLDAYRDEITRLRRGGNTLGQIIDRQGRELIELTDSQDVIGDDGDGDWQIVWDRLHEMKRALDVAQDEIERKIADIEALRERLEWEQPEPDSDVIQVTDHTGDDQDYESDPPTWGRVRAHGELGSAPSEWKGYKNGGKVYLEWPELVRRWGPLTATMWDTSCDGSMVGCPPGEHSHIGGVGRGGAS